MTVEAVLLQQRPNLALELPDLASGCGSELVAVSEIGRKTNKNHRGGQTPLCRSGDRGGASMLHGSHQIVEADMHSNGAGRSAGRFAGKASMRFVNDRSSPVGWDWG
jgi:hypothetical protein